MMTEAAPVVSENTSRDRTVLRPGELDAGISPSWQWCWAAACFGLYLLFAIVELGPSNSISSTHVSGAFTHDTISQMWFLEWVKYAITHGHNPFFSQWMNYPHGTNVVTDTSMIALGVIMSPITALFGPVVAYNVLLRLALALSAFSMCLVSRRCIRWWPASFASGLLYGFSPYIIHNTDHIFSVFVPLTPFVFLLLYEALVRQRWRPAITGSLLGATMGVQYLISSEILVSTIVIGAVAGLLYLLMFRHELARKWAYVRTCITLALIVGGAVLVYPVMYTLIGAEHLNGAPKTGILLTDKHGDLLSLLITHQWWPKSQGITMYLGVPLVIAVVFIVVWLRHRRIVMLAGCLAVISYILSLGSTLYVDGSDTHIPLPFAVLAHIPFVDGLLQVRFSLYTDLFCAFILAVGMDELHKRIRRSHRFDRLQVRWRGVVATVLPLALAVIVVIPLVPNVSRTSHPTDVPSFFTSNSVNLIPPGSVVLSYPYPSGGQPETLLDQAVSGMRFKLFGGFGWWPEKGEPPTNTPPALEPKVVETFFYDSLHGIDPDLQSSGQANLGASLRLFLLRYHVDAVIVLPVGQNPAAVVRLVTSVIGPPSQFSGVTIWLHVEERLGTGPASAPSSPVTPLAPPTITSFSPTSGPVGTKVTIKGTNLSGATKLTFNGTVATITKHKDSRIKVTVPTGATTGKIAVTTSGGTVTSTSNFAVT